MRRHAALAAAVAATVAAAPAPANLQAIECALHNVALTVALYNLENTSYVYDSLTAALNLQEVCGTGAGGGGVRGGAVLNDEAVAALAASRAAFARGAWPTRPAVPYPTAAATAFYVAPGGSDAAAGTAAAPFATLARAQAAMRGVPVATRQAGGAAVWIAGGVYHLNATLLLTPEDSYVTWSALPGDPAGPVVLTGSLDLSGASWAPVSAGSSILVTKVSLPDARRDAWAARGRAGAAPPVATNQLFVDGRRMVRARWPNANPEGGDGLCFSKPQRPGEGCGGYTTCVTTQLGTQPAPPAAWNVPPNLTPNRGNSPTLGCNGCGDSYGTFSMYSVYPPPEGHPVYNVPLPGLGFPNASVFSAWPSPFSRAAGVAIDTRCASGLAPLLPALAAGPADTAVVHMFHGMLWGGWQFVVGGVAPGGSSANLTFSYGGYQEARGGPINGGTHWYIENALPLLDAPGEWFYDADAGELYLWPNGTAPFSGAVTVPALEALIRVQGVNGSAPGGADYVTGVGFVGLTFTQTRATFLEQYEVPSGGDWSIHRGGALVVEDAEELLLANCTFSHVGGNAVLLSNHVWRANLTANEAVYPGDSGFALVGSAVLADGSAPTYPNQVTIDFNHIHEIGVYGKQTSAVFLAKSANVSVLNNVFYNGPRALINFNDGFAGGHRMDRNLMFNAVRETGDHGPLNSWDRLPYWTLNGIDDGFHDPAGRSLVKARDIVSRNFMINGGNGVWNYDRDDGSQFVNDTSSVMLWGGCKNYLGNSKSCDQNLIIYPGIDPRSTGDRRCQTNDDSVQANGVYWGNRCIEQDGLMYKFSGCNPKAPVTTTYFTYNNTHYSSSGFNLPCGNGPALTFAQWQALGQDAGSTVSSNVPSVGQLVTMATDLLFETF